MAIILSIHQYYEENYIPTFEEVHAIYMDFDYDLTEDIWAILNSVNQPTEDEMNMLYSFFGTNDINEMMTII
jgi:hypothetical protein